jgi:hypothetical protein
MAYTMQRIGNGYVRIDGVAPIAQTRAPTRVTNDPAAARVALRQVNLLDKALDRLEDALRRAKGTAQSVQGSVALTTTSVPGTYATMSSTSEVNTETSAYSPTSPSWSGTSTSGVTVGGTYSGAQGSTTLTFSTSGGPATATVGSSPITLAVTTTSGASLGNISWSPGDAGTAKTLSNGLTVTLGAGNVKRGESFQLTVSDAAQAVDPTVAFSGDPNFQTGTSVTAGSFTINGTSISVSTSDTIDSVIARITASAAGVTAEFDSVNEKVVLTQKTAGATPTITLGSDSSGFLSAVRLTGATVVPGTDSPVSATSPMDAFPDTSSVTAGNIVVNGTSIAINPSTMSVYDVLDAIEAAVPEVAVALNETTGKVVIGARSASGSFTLSSGGTGFFDALGIDEGTYSGRVGVSSRASAAAAGAMRDVTEALLALHDDTEMGIDGTSAVPSAVTALRSAFEQVVKARFGTSTNYDTGFGVAFDFDRADDPQAKVIDFSRSDVSRFSRAFRYRSEEVRGFFLDPLKGVDNKGMIHALRGILDTVGGALERAADG